jgi:hypothetical protein
LPSGIIARAKALLSSRAEAVGKSESRSCRQESGDFVIEELISSYKMCLKAMRTSKFTGLVYLIWSFPVLDFYKAGGHMELSHAI